MPRRFSGKVPMIPIGADTSEADAKLDKLFSRINDLQHIKIDANISMVQRNLDTLSKRASGQLTKGLVSGAMKDFKTLLGAMKTEFEAHGATSAYKSMEATHDVFVKKFANIFMEVDGKTFAGLETILNNVKDFDKITRFQLDDIVSDRAVKNSETILKNTKKRIAEEEEAAKKQAKWEEDHEVSKVLKQIRRRASGDSIKTDNVTKLNTRKRKLQEDKNTLSDMLKMDNPSIKASAQELIGIIDQELSKVETRIESTVNTVKSGEKTMKDFLQLWNKASKNHSAEDFGSRYGKLMEAITGDSPTMSITDAYNELERREKAYAKQIEAQRKQKELIGQEMQTLVSSLPSLQEDYKDNPNFLKEYTSVLSKVSDGSLTAAAATEKLRDALSGLNQETEKSAKQNLGYHAGDLGKAESYGQHVYGRRDTGHFGTGTYFVGDPKQIEGYNKRDGAAAPVETIDFSKYNLFKPKDTDQAYDLHRALQMINHDLINLHKYDGLDLPSIKQSLEDGDESVVQDFINKYLGDIVQKYAEEAIDNKEYLATLTEADIRREEEAAWDTAYNMLHNSFDDFDALDDDLLVRDLEVEDAVQNRMENIRDTLSNFDLNKEIARRVIYDIEHGDFDGMQETQSLKDTLVDRLSKIFVNRSKEELSSALDATFDTISKYDASQFYKVDNASTVFMKQLGYEGIDTRHTDLDNTMYGSVIYDLKGEDLARRQEILKLAQQTTEATQQESNAIEDNTQAVEENVKAKQKKSKIKVREWTDDEYASHQEQYEQKHGTIVEDTRETMDIIRSATEFGDKFAVDMITACKKAETAVKRFFDAIDPEKYPAIAAWKDSILESMQSGVFSGKEILSDGTFSNRYNWGVEAINEDEFYIYFNLLDVASDKEDAYFAKRDDEMQKRADGIKQEYELYQKLMSTYAQLVKLRAQRPKFNNYDQVGSYERLLDYYNQEKVLLQDIVSLKQELKNIPGKYKEGLNVGDLDLHYGTTTKEYDINRNNLNIKNAQKMLDEELQVLDAKTTPSKQISMFVGMADPIFEAADATHQLAGAMQEVVDVHPNQVSFDELLDLYHAGDLSNIANTLKSFPLGNVPPRKGNGIGGLTGLYTTDDVSGFWGTEWHGAPISTIDPSGYKLLNARSNEIAEKVGGFLNDLNATIYGYYEAIDEKDWTLKRYTDVKTIEELYAAHNELFAESTLSMEQFAQFINGAKEKIVGKSFADIQLPAIDEGIAKSGISSALQDVADELFNSDSFQTQFLKMLGYEGVDLRGTKYNGTYSGGSVIFDPRQESLKATNEKWSDFMSRHGYEIGEDDLRHEEKRRQLAFETAKAYSKQSEESSKLLDQSQAQAKAEASIAESAQEAVKFKLETSRDADIKEQLQLFDDGLGELTTDMLSIDPSGQLQSQMQQKIQDARNKVENGLLETADAYVEIVGGMGKVFADMQQASESTRKLTGTEYAQFMKGVDLNKFFAEWGVEKENQGVIRDAFAKLGDMIVSKGSADKEDADIQGQVQNITSLMQKHAQEYVGKTEDGLSWVLEELVGKILYTDQDVASMGGKDVFKPIQAKLKGKLSLTKVRKASHLTPDVFFESLSENVRNVIISQWENTHSGEFNYNPDTILEAIADTYQQAKDIKAHAGEAIFGELQSQDAIDSVLSNANALIDQAVGNAERLLHTEQKITEEVGQQNVERTDAEEHRPNIVEHEVEKKIQQLRDANNNDKALINFKGAFTQEDLLKEFQSFAQNVDGLELDVGKITIQGDTAHVQLYNDALKTTIDQTWKLKEASEEAGTTLEFVNQRYNQNVKALKEDNFDVDGVKAVAKSRVEKLRVDADRAKYDLTELDQLADSIASQDDFKKFNHQLEAAKNHIDAIKKATVTENSMNQLANMQRDMQNANLELDTMHLKLQKLGDLEGVEKAEGTISAMRDAVDAFNNAKNADEQKTAYNKYSDLKSSFNAQMRYLNALKSVTPAGDSTDGANNIEKYYQDVLSTVKQINALDIKINDLKTKDGGSGVYGRMIASLEADKGILLGKIDQIGEEINQEFQGVFIPVADSDKVKFPLATLLEDTNSFATLLNFFNDVDVQSTLSTEKINAFVQSLQKSQDVKFEMGSKIASQFNDVYVVMNKLNKMSDDGLISQDSTAYQTAINAYQSLVDMKQQFGADTSKWSASQIAAFSNASKQVVDYTNTIMKAAEQEKKYFAGMNKHDPNAPETALAVVDKEVDSAREKLEKFVREFKGGQGIITDFKTLANGVNQIEFSFFDEATQSYRTFKAAMGQFNDDIYWDESSMKNMTAGTDAAKKSLISLGNTINQLKQIDGTEEIISGLAQRVKELQDALRGSENTKDVGVQRDLKNKAAETDRDIKNAEKAAKAWQKIQDTIDEGKATNIGQIDKNGDKQTQMFEKIQQAANGAKISIKGFDAEASELTYTLTDTSGNVTTMVAKMHELNGAVVTQQTDTRKLRTAWQDIGSSMGDVGKEIGRYAVNMLQVMDVVRYVRQGFGEVLKIDTALTELKKVTDESEASYSNFLQSTSKSAGAIGSTVSDFTEATANFARLGYTMEESADMAKTAIVYKNVADGLDTVEESTDSIISTMKAFGIESNDTMSIVDRFNEVGNNFAITSAGIGEALQRSASALYESGNTIDESIALVTAGNQVIQNPEQVGTALKTLALRLRGAKTELEEAGLEADNMAESTSTLQAKLKALTHGKVDIMQDADTFKNTTQILREMAGAWEDMTDIERSAALELMGGKRQANILASVIKNFDTVEDVIKTSLNSEGSALQENAKYMESLQGHIDQFNNSTQTMWMNFMNADATKFLIDMATSAVNLTDKMGLLNVAIAAFAGKTAFKADSFGQFVSADQVQNIFNAVKGVQGLTVATKAATVSAGLMNAALTAGTSLFAGVAISAALKGLDNLINKTEKTAHAADKALNTYKDAQKTLKQQKASVDDLSVSYEKLSQGVNVNTNENINLPTDAYQEYLNVCNEIADIYPHLVSSFDEQGNAILSLKGNAEELVQTYKDAAQASRQELIASGKDIFDTFKNTYSNDPATMFESTGLVQQVKLAEKLQELINSGTDKEIGKFFSDLNAGNIEIDGQKYSNVELADLAESSGLDTSFKDGWSFDVDAFKQQSSKILSFIKSTNTKINTETKNVKTLMDAYLGEDLQYVGLEQNAKNAVDGIISNLNAEFISGFDNADDLWTWVKTNVIDQFADQTFGKELSSQIDNALALQSQFTTGDDLLVGPYKEQMLSFVEWISASHLDTEVQKQILDMFKIDQNDKDSIGDNIDQMLDYAGSILDDKAKERLGQLSYADLQLINSSNFKAPDNVTMSWEQLQAQINAAKIATTQDFTVSSLTDYTENIDAVSASISTYKEALDNLESGNFTMADFIGLIKQFPDLADGVDTSSKSFNGLSKNLKKAIRNSPEKLIDDLKELRKRLEAAGKSTDVIDDLINSLSNMPDDAFEGITDWGETIEEQFSAAKQAIAELQKAMELNPNANFEARGGAIEQMKTLMEQGMIGSASELWDIAKAFGFTYESAKTINENADALYKYISARETWYKQDKDSNYTYDGTKSFIEAVDKAAQGKEWEAVLAKHDLTPDDFTWDYKDGKLDFKFDNANFDKIVSALSEMPGLVGLTSAEFADLLVQIGQFHEIDWETADDVSTHMNNIAAGSGTATEKIKNMSDTVERYAEKVLGMDLDMENLDLTQLSKPDDVAMDEWTSLLKLLGEYKILVSEVSKNDSLGIGFELDKAKGLEGLFEIPELQNSIKRNSDGVVIVDEDALKSTLQTAGYTEEAIDNVIKKIEHYQILSERTPTDPLGLSGAHASIENASAALKDLGVSYTHVTDEMGNVELRIHAHALVDTLAEQGWTSEQISSYLANLTSGEHDVPIQLNAEVTQEEIDAAVLDASQKDIQAELAMNTDKADAWINATKIVEAKLNLDTTAADAQLRALLGEGFVSTGGISEEEFNPVSTESQISANEQAKFDAFWARHMLPTHAGTTKELVGKTELTAEQISLSGEVDSGEETNWLAKQMVKDARTGPSENLVGKTEITAEQVSLAGDNGVTGDQASWDTFWKKHLMLNQNDVSGAETSPIDSSSILSDDERDGWMSFWRSFNSEQKRKENQSDAQHTTGDTNQRELNTPEPEFDFVEPNIAIDNANIQTGQMQYGLGGEFDELLGGHDISRDDAINEDDSESHYQQYQQLYAALAEASGLKLQAEQAEKDALWAQHMQGFIDYTKQLYQEKYGPDGIQPKQADSQEPIQENTTLLDMLTGLLFGHKDAKAEEESEFVSNGVGEKHDQLDIAATSVEEINDANDALDEYNQTLQSTGEQTQGASDQATLMWQNYTSNDAAMGALGAMQDQYALLGEASAEAFGVETDFSGFVTVSDALDQLSEKKQEISQPVEMTVESAVSNIDSQIASIEQMKSLIQSDWKILPEVETDLLTALDAQISALQEQKITLQAELQVQSAEESVSGLTEEQTVPVVPDTSAVDAYSPDDKPADVIYEATMTPFTPPTLYGTIVYNSVGGGGGAGKNVTMKYADGTAHAQGTAYKSGSWGAQESSNALVGELGPELRVRGNQWTLLGEQGAEFADVKKGDIIFNHKQTESLLANGYVTGRGKAYAEGSGTFTKYTFKDTTGSNRKNSSDKLSQAAKDMSDASDELKEVFDWIEVRVEEITERIDLMSAKLENAIGSIDKNTIVDSMIEANKDLYDNLIAGAEKYAEYAAELLKEVPEEYREAAQDGSIAIESFTGEVGEKALEAIENYREWVQKGADVTQQAEEVLTEISGLAKQAIDNIAEDYENKVSIPGIKLDQLEAYNDLLETTVGAESEKIYQAMIDANKQNIDTLANQRDAMQAELNKRVEAGEIKKYSQDWYDAIKDIADVDTEIIELTTDVNDLQDSINELHFDHFDNLLGRFEAISNEAENLIDILGSEDLVDKDTAEWTDAGITSLGLYAQQLENAEMQASKYAEEIDYLNKNWKQLGYTEQEYAEKLEELKEGQYDAIKAYNDTKKAIKDLTAERVDAIKKGIEKEIEAYEELINKKKEELDAEKDLHGFQKGVAEQQKEIADIERKLAALSADNSASARAKRAQLEAELLKAQADLEETYYDRSVQDQQEALDKELEAFREEKNKEIESWDEYLENTELVVSDSLAMIQANTDVVYQTLQAMGQEYSLSIAEAITSPWADGAIAVQSYSEQFGLSMSSTVEELQRVADEYKRIMAEIENVGNESISKANASVAKYQEATYTAPAKVEQPKKEPEKVAVTVSTPAPATSSSSSGSSGGGSSKKNNNKNKNKSPSLSSAQKQNAQNQNKEKKPATSTVLKGGSATNIIKIEMMKYAKGTRGTGNSQLALIDELGEELVLRPQNGRMTFLEKGTGVIPADLTANLMEWGALDPSAILERNRPAIGISPEVHNTEFNITMDIAEVVHIDRVDKENLPDLTKTIEKQLDKYMKNLNAQIRRYTNR